MDTVLHHAAREEGTPGAPVPGLPRHVRVAIVGAGFGGLGTAIRLRQEGIDDFVVLERAHDVGGTWRDNSYPGCQCDVPSHLYSFSFAPNAGWSRTFSHQAEIHRYLQDCAERFGILPHLRFGHEVLGADWDERRQVWQLETSRGSLTADVVVAGPGPLSEPSLPDIPGLEGFEGIAFHSASWNHDHDLAGERVAVIGTGASAIQFVPRIQPDVSRLHVFQRTPPWVLPHPDRPISRAERGLYRLVPGLRRLVRSAIYWGRETFVLAFAVDRRIMGLPERIARAHLRRQVPDPQLRARLTPDYRLGCKRILLSNDWYPALVQPNVELVTDAIREVRPRSIVTADGVEREVDTIIFGTGFHVTDMPVAHRVRGRGGRTLAEAWRGSPQAYVGSTVAGFPNLFFLLGPNTGLGHTSVVFMIEAQIEHALGALRAMARCGAAAVEVRPEVQAAFNAGVQQKMRGTVWTAGGCASWYIDATGRNSTLWPDFTFRFRNRARRFAVADYELVAAAAEAGTALERAA
jgi:cation diffusion facilitator CzcD-associated flavoprotein CzcO